MRCRGCGCTDVRACPTGCWWVGVEWCSACAVLEGLRDAGLLVLDGLHDVLDHDQDDDDRHLTPYAHEVLLDWLEEQEASL